MAKLTWQEAKSIDMVDYLASLGHYPDPKKSRNGKYWYLSPLPGRNEREPSFKVDQKKNVWYDHGAGIGGNIIAFGLLYYGCSKGELLEKLQNVPSFNQPIVRMANVEGEDTEEGKIRIKSVKPLSSPVLIHYAHSREIPTDLIKTHCCEAVYELYGKEYYAIGFRNDRGGYELRNKIFKSSSTPKHYTFIDNHAKTVCVFEGFFSFLSFLTIYQNKPLPVTNYLILNSASFFRQAQSLMEGHECIYLFLDQDATGIKWMKQAFKASGKYKVCSNFYFVYKDLNEKLVASKTQKNDYSTSVTKYDFKSLEEELHRIGFDDVIDRLKKYPPNSFPKVFNVNRTFSNSHHEVEDQMTYLLHIEGVKEPYLRDLSARITRQIDKGNPVELYAEFSYEHGNFPTDKQIYEMFCNQFTKQKYSLQCLKHERVIRDDGNSKGLSM